MITSIPGFYSGAKPDDRGRFVGEIQGWDYRRLEAVHDYIQWLFPLPEPSPVNPSAPVLTEEVIAEFRRRPELRSALRESFRTMLDFYGYQFGSGPTVAVAPTRESAARARNWLTPGNHNLLRITRILRCTKLLGLEEEALAFFRVLKELYETEAGKRAIGRTSFRYWEEAIR